MAEGPAGHVELLDEEDLYPVGRISSGRLHIGCVLASRKGRFCRVLHTQVLKVIDFTHRWSLDEQTRVRGETGP